MTCSLANREEKLLDYVSGSLESREAVLFEKHLEACGACREFVVGQKAVWNSLDLFEPAPVSGDFNRRLYARIAQTSWWDRLVASVRFPFRAPGIIRQGLPLAGAVALIAAAVVVLDRPARTPSARQATLSAQAESLQPEKIQRALDDMEMLREFNHLVASDPAQSKM
jgi:anti-sigma factor RsiW